ncbi:tachykinins-like isoform X2 [Odontomachus brunneus]|uniref:tachykinins-like isoform X2 n=1 Tax=Odontomachus brunneus TaxID=486640 RepID=UPI0013F27505|nr:tachykinins-like isoform X2 [Odontomachus brunneus]
MFSNSYFHRMHINSIFFLAIWMTSVAEELPVNNVQPTKQTSLRFPEIREKKYPISLEYGDFSKRAQIGFQNMRGNKYFITPNVDEDFSHDEFEKRASMGFQGMRGKKDYLTSDFKDFYLHNDYKKKALMGFQGMRGKKVVSEDGYYKRAPMGFQGMRGKKSMEENTGGKKSYVFENPQEHEKRFLGMGFQGMRGKKENFPVEWEKRIPIGFQGIRDKETLLDEIEDFEKRVTSFQDTRGKKDTFQNYVDYYIDTMDFDKRALMGFQGMRGKKDSDKRTSMGFQGMRGKRNMGRRFGIGTVFKIRSSSDNQGECHNNYVAASRLYAERFLQRRHPTNVTIRSLTERACNGHLVRQRQHREYENDAQALTILAADHRNPHIYSNAVTLRNGNCYDTPSLD